MIATLARAWAVSRGDGLVLGFTDHDGELQFDGIRFRPEAGLTAHTVIQTSGLSVDNSGVEGALSNAAITEADLVAGRWDGAGIRMWEVDWRDPNNRRLVFRGSFGEITRSAGAFRAELRGLSEALAQSRGRVFHRRCSAQLGDGACRADLSGAGMFAEAVIAEVDAGRVFRFPELAGHEAGWFEHGLLRVLDGDAEGLEAPIRSDALLPGGGREVVLWKALAADLRSGDRARLVAGCDKRARTCRGKFGNFLNFRGFPHLPQEDWLLAPQAVARYG